MHTYPQYIIKILDTIVMMCIIVIINKGVNMSKGELTKFTKSEMFLRYVSLQKDLKALEVDLDEQWKKLKESMIENDINKVEGDWGSISIEKQSKYKKVGEVDAQFTKIELDTKKVSAHNTLTGELPDGVEKSEIIKLVKRFK
jgi:hypothetical protein